MPSSFSSRNNTSRLQRAPLARSSSLLGTIKNIVTAPLSWFGAADEFDNVDGKRKLTSLPSTRDVSPPDDQRSSKRQRRHSPEPLPPSHNEIGAYLDPNPEMLLPPPHRGHFGSSLAVPSASKQQQQHRQARRSHSPYPTTSYGFTNPGPRTQSMDPPHRRAGSYDPPLTPTPLSRDVSMEAPPPSSPHHDGSSSPSRTRFRMRTSLTPQPSSQSFGPVTVRRERDTSEPPLTSLVSHPVFVKAPSSSQPQPSLLSREPSATLGTLVESRRTSAPPARQHSNLHIGKNTSSDLPSGAPSRHINAAEKALQELDVYKTPLLPSRLKGSSTIPEMFRPKRTHPPVLMRGDRDDRPRLGMSEKPGAKRKTKEEKGSKPYSGQGGMKKLLARRRLEEEVEKEKEREAAIEVEGETTPGKVSVNERMEEAERKEPEPLPFTQPAEAEVSTTQIGSRPQSTLRVGRTRIARSHAPAVQSKSRNRFSAIYEEDGDEQMLATDEGALDTSAKQAPGSPKPAPLFQPPAGFSFAINAAPIKHDDSTAKDPPIATLPFSIKATTPTPKPVPEVGIKSQPAPFFSKPLLTPAPSASVSEFALAPVTVAAAVAPVIPVPSIALVPPSPAQNATSSSLKALQSQGGEPRPGLSVPNFFANSSYLKNSAVQLPSAFSLVSPAPSTEKVPEVKVAAPPPSTPAVAPGQPQRAPTQASVSSLGPAAAVGEKRFEASGAPSKPSFFSASPPSLFSAQPVASAPSSFSTSSTQGLTKESTAAPASTPFSFGPPTTKAEEKPVTTAPFSFGPPSKPAEKATSPPAPFSFGPSAKTAEPAVAPPSSPFSFGPPKADATKEGGSRPTSDTSKPSPLFGNAPPVQSPFSFGPPTASPVELPKSAFSFNTPPAPANATAPAADAPKPLFPPSTPAPVFSFGPSGGSSVTEAPTASKSPFTFIGSKPSTPTTPAPEKSTFSFAASSPAPASGSVLFGAPSGSNGADVSSKPFSYASNPLLRAVTPPKGDTEVLMDESPVRGGGMDINGGSKPQESSKPTGFPFGDSSSTRTTSSPFGFGTSSNNGPFGNAAQQTKAPEKPTVTTFSDFGTTNASPFGGFGQKAAEQAKPPTASPFSFGPASTTPTSTSSPFSFNAAPGAGAGSGFGQGVAASNSAPASPLGFKPFSFNAPASGAANVASASTTANAPQTNAAFTFVGSQPASPATGNISLPQSSSAAFTFGQQANPAPASSPSPFGAPAPLPPTSTPLFTLGAAPPPPMTGIGGRPLKKLPSRRAGKR